MYSSQKSSSRKRCHNHPEYSKVELKNWLINQGKFLPIYNTWVDSGYKKELTPSVDRLNDRCGYKFENIRLVTWGINVKSYYSSVRDGSSKICRPVLQFDKSGEFIREFATMKKAEVITSINVGSICRCCRGQGKSAGGFIWRYK